VITLRDAQAVSNAARLGIPPDRLRQTADPAFGLIVPHTCGGVSSSQAAARAGVGTSRFNVGVALRRVPRCYLGERTADEQSQRTFLNSIGEALRRLLAQTPADLTLIPMQLHPADDDRLLLSELRTRLGQPERIRLIEAYESPTALLREFERLDFLVGMRFHSVVFGLLAQIPLVAIDYDASRGKVTGVMQAMELGDFVVNMADVSAPRLWEQIASGLAQRESLRRRIAAGLSTIREAEATNAAELRSLLEQACSYRPATCPALHRPRAQPHGQQSRRLDVAGLPPPRDNR
jgi:polysaccharide pyruvyl transferase WcaK-like protein